MILQGNVFKRGSRKWWFKMKQPQRIPLGLLLYCATWLHANYNLMSAWNFLKLLLVKCSVSPSNFIWIIVFKEVVYVGKQHPGKDEDPNQLTVNSYDNVTFYTGTPSGSTETLDVLDDGCKEVHIPVPPSPNSIASSSPSKSRQRKVSYSFHLKLFLLPKELMWWMMIY